MTTLTADDSADAAELALGLLEGAERAAALRRMLAEPDFAREVERWRTHFAVMFANYASVEPPADALDRLGLGEADARPWRWATGVASLIAAGLAVALVVRPAPVAPPVSQPVPTTPLTFAAAMSGEADKPFAALFDARAGQVRVPAGVTVPAGKVAELWRIGADGVPHALGLLSREGTTALRLSEADRAALAAGATLAISIEPPGGAPGALPTGPVVATGALTRL